MIDILKVILYYCIVSLLLLSSVLKTVVLLILETDTFFQDSLKETWKEQDFLCNIANIFTVTFDRFNASFNTRAHRMIDILKVISYSFLFSLIQARMGDKPWISCYRADKPEESVMNQDGCDSERQVKCNFFQPKG